MSDTTSLGSKVFLSRKEASTLTGLSPKTITRLISSRKLKSIRVGRRRLIPPAELDQFIIRDHRINVPQTEALRRRTPRTRNRQKSAKRFKYLAKNRRQAKRLRKSPRKVSRARRKKSGPAITDPRVVRALGFMRRTGASASEAARRERMKLKTLRQRAGRYLYRSGSGKPWKVRSEDQLAVSMTLLTQQGRIEVIIRNSRERRLLHQYESAVRMFRAAEDGAEEALKQFEGKTIGGHKLVTDVKLLIQLEEADELDYDSLYTAVGVKS